MMQAKGSTNGLKEIIETACCFGRYSEDSVWKDGLEEAVKGYVGLILQSKEFEEAACEYCREAGWREPQ